MSTPAIPIDTEPNGQPLLLEFLKEYGRLPRIGDDHDPWTFRGWLLPYLAMCEMDPRISPRYDYVARTIAAGKLLDEPIPQIDFVSEHAPEAREGMKMLEQMVKIVEQGGRYNRGIETVAEWLGFAVGVRSESSEIDRDDQEQLYRLFDVSKWLLAPTDYLGEQMAATGVGRAAAFFPTPMSLCTMTAMMTYMGGDARMQTAHDPAVGTGRTLLVASNFCLRLFGQDINSLCVLVSKINFALFAPWHLIPASYFPVVTQTNDAELNTVSSSPVALSDTNGPKTPTIPTKHGQLSLFDLLGGK